MSKFSHRVKAKISADGEPFLIAGDIYFWEKDGSGNRIIPGRTYSVSLEIEEVAHHFPRHQNCRCVISPILGKSEDEKYEEFMSRSPEEVTLAIFDRLGVKLTPRLDCDDGDRSWAE